MTTADTRRAESSGGTRTFEQLVDLAGLLCGLCDRAEHNEGFDREELLQLGERLRSAGLRMLAEAGLEPIAAYGARLRQMENKNVLQDDDTPAIADDVLDAGTWRRVQLVQARHDQAFHPDVLGLPKNQQLQHYALHLGKLARHRMLADRSAQAWADWSSGRIADSLIFGVKLATVANHKLADAPLR